ncbi:RagB/SusD family nutrient uptake outer membrane protein [Pedobacter helvus]|uniref:RagB/SusD family nutrient uptake outer membrane protein n=1 Tax=Pedobacter helvus TaxID=2563444 RepID=A0ABW9JLI9_9SPHI|nr:RagB/SusD family nutrient uptake outer membrane protein [Pedobacter ureilyticus]
MIEHLKIRKASLLLSIVLMLVTGCEKYLDVKPDKKIATPEKLSDLEGMLDYYGQLNARYPQAAEISADNYYLNDAGWASSSELHQNYYLWQKYDLNPADWNFPYENIYVSNVILETLPQINYPLSENTRANQIKGGALLLRGYFYLALVQLFAPVYHEATAGNDLGIPIRHSSEVNEPSVRATVRENYNQIIKDLEQAIPLLPALPHASYKHRASRAAAYGTLARTYLIMQKYSEAGLYADSCLQLNSTLMDYNTISTTSTIPFRQFNDEVVYDTKTTAPSALAQTRAKVDEALYQSYQLNDLRRTIFFRLNTDGSKAFKGNYTGLGTAAMFTGIATDEMYLIRAEAYARAGRKEMALADLNSLLVKRFKTGTYNLATALDAQEALDLVLRERRKELVFRTLRWSDLRRLNKEPRYRVDLIRTINGIAYELKHDSDRYTLQISAEVINRTGMPQNP